MSSLCTLLGYTRQAFYKYQQQHQKQALETELLLQQVLKIRQLQPQIGTRKLMVLLGDFMKDHNIELGRDGLFDLLREHRLLVRKRKRKAHTTFSRHWYSKYPNLIKGMEPRCANELWVSDITYIPLKERFGYLSLVTDAYSRKIVGHFLSATLEAWGSVNALKMAIKNASGIQGLIHHSDRGIQYCCNDYVKVLKTKSIGISMTENGDPYENAIAERVNGILKEELLQRRYNTLEEATKSVTAAITIYNTLRPHASCNMLTPQQAHLQTGPLRKHWKNYYATKQKEVIV